MNWSHTLNLVLMTGLIVCTVLLFRSCENNKESERVSRQNVYALNDSVSVIKLKNKQLETQRGLFVSNIEELEKLNKELSVEVKKESGKVKYISKIKIVYVDSSGPDLDLITGIVEGKDDGLWRSFVRSTSPNKYLQFDIVGAVIDPLLFTDKKYWHLGPYAGIGVNALGEFQMSIGVSIMFSLYSF